MSDWISVKETLPPENETVLVYGGGDIHKGRRIKDIKLSTNGLLPMASSDGGTLVSHWQFLPDSPLSEKKRHRCTNGAEGNFLAEEDDEGFFLSYGSIVRDRVYVNIVSCPFCGWSEEKKQWVCGSSKEKK